MKIKILLASILLLVGLTSSVSIKADDYTVDTPTSITPIARWTMDWANWNNIGVGLVETVNGSGIFDLQTVGPNINPSSTNRIGGTVESTGGSPAWDLQTKGDGTGIIPPGSYSTIDGFSISLWLRFNTLPTSDYLIIEHGTAASGTRGWKLTYNQTSSVLEFQSAPTSVSAYAVTVSHSTVLVINTWYHVVITYNGSTSVSLHVANIVVAGVPIGNSIAIPPEKIYVLGSIVSAGVDVLIDELYLYDSKLSSADIALLNDSRLPASGDYLFITNVAIENTTTTTFTNQTLATELNLFALITGSFVLTDLRDFQVFQQTGAQSNTMVTSPPTVTGTAYSFSRLDTVPPSSFTSYDILTSNSSTCLCSELRSQAYLFTGDDEVQVLDDASIDITDNLAVISLVDLNANPISTPGWIVNKWTANTGYAFGFDTSGDLELRLDASTFTVTPATTRNNFSFSKIGTAVKIYEGSRLILSAIGPATITANAVDLNIGTNLDADITEVEVLSAFGSGSDVTELFFDFQPGRFTQTQEGLVGNGWQWIGNLIHTGVSSTTATYLIDNNMDDFIITVGDLSILEPEIIANLTTTTPDIIGNLPDIAGSDPLASTVGAGVPFRALINNVAVTLDVKPASIWFMMMLAIAYMLAIIVSKTMRNNLLAVATVPLTILGGSSAGFYAVWMTAFVAVYSFSFYAIDALRKSRSI